MSAPRNQPRARRAAPGLSVVLALIVTTSAIGQERPSIPLLSVDAGVTQATASAPDAVRPVRRRTNLHDAVAQALDRNPTARVAAEDIRRVSQLLAAVSAATTEGARGIEQLNGAVRR